MTDDTLNLFVSVLGDKLEVYTTPFDSREEVEKEIRKAGSEEEEIWDFMTFDPKNSDGLEILWEMSVTDEVRNTLEELATAMFEWGRKFEREDLQKKIGLEK